MCASGAKGRAIRLWKVFTGETLAPLEGHSYGVNSAAHISAFNPLPPEYTTVPSQKPIYLVMLGHTFVHHWEPPIPLPAVSRSASLSGSLTAGPRQACA